MGLWLQYLVIVLAAVASAGVVWKKQFPNSWRRTRTALALALLRQSSPLAQRLGRRMAPPASGNAGACGGCDSCGPTPPKR
ncbi:hypothetical protein ARC20_12660 [Stenotrophomonas panacihumi]|uniref:Uncharacterized protein n=1 Tax=Stenotrophomonas panacihumi TaxID=676599 RepID=A0A0R0AFQ1_9GAMM|nr:DUF6587 family protein [Stenotrophomonas panacihumi]KRG40670.1 hypothetical protein ARC20_12660 [Stenotrophomonas panacihumi]PTN53721.1 hypothetical protein C9J98_13990 [Stenotrophomonas panacihumi]